MERFERDNRVIVTLTVDEMRRKLGLPDYARPYFKGETIQHNMDPTSTIEFDWHRAVKEPKGPPPRLD